VYVHAICGQEFDCPAGNFNNIKCFACLENPAMTYATIHPSTFEEAEFSTLPVCWDIQTAGSIFHDEVVDEEKAAEERLSTQPRKKSFRKGCASFLASLPGGASAGAICLRAGWSMGQVRDIYQTQVGDKFVGCVVQPFSTW
jgi:hypothetical protein